MDSMEDASYLPAIDAVNALGLPVGDHSPPLFCVRALTDIPLLQV